MNGREAIVAYLALMARQHETLVACAGEVGAEGLWWQPGPKQWSIGENLDHLRVIYHSMLGMIRGAWAIFAPLARLRRGRPYQVEIDNVYRRPAFPQKVGWIWPPKYTPGHPVLLPVLRANLDNERSRWEAFYTTHDPDLLGNVYLWDPAIGSLNLIQTLRVGTYHDEMHLEQVQETAHRWQAKP